MSTYDERRKARIRARIAGRKAKRKRREQPEDVDRLRRMAEDTGVKMTDQQLEDIARGMREGR